MGKNDSTSKKDKTVHDDYSDNMENLMRSKSEISFITGSVVPSTKPKRIKLEKPSKIPLIITLAIMVIGLLEVVLSMIQVYHILGFLFGLFLFLISFLVIALSRMHSSEHYEGIWCDFCTCLPADDAKRDLLSEVFKGAYFALGLFALLLSLIQIANIARAPDWSTFPIECTVYENEKYCIRVSNDSPVNADDIIDTYIMSYNLANGLTSFKNDIFFCL